MLAGVFPCWKISFFTGRFYASFFFVFLMACGGMVRASDGAAFSEVMARAEKGNAAAQLELALRYADGNGVGVDYKKGFYWLKKSAESGYPVSQFNMGQIYEKGLFEVQQDVKKAVFWYEKAAEKEDADARFHLGLLYLESRGVEHDPGKAAFFLAKAAEQGHAVAQYFLGTMYEFGVGIEPDHEIAAALYEDADRNGFSSAKTRLARLGKKAARPSLDYDNSTPAAVMVAAQGGNPAAQLELANLLLDGEKVELDADKALEWVNKAVAQEYAPAMHVLSMMYMTGEGVSEDKEAALKWMQKAAGAGYDASQYNLGLHYQTVSGTRADYMKARHWYAKAAEQGNPRAQINLGQMYEKGMGVPVDMRLAAKWYMVAARQGWPVGQHNIAWMYANGMGVPQDTEKADYWYFAFLANGEEVVNPILDAVTQTEEKSGSQIPAWLDFVFRNGDVIGNLIRDWGEMRYGRY